ncbi:diacylglycerol kinase family lipid kinase [Candidatus Woesearchaeota archaeon]|nr:diacylglycerol kinase family lipid kinase [Candidatus Woesearchaeota archaeon]
MKCENSINYNRQKYTLIINPCSGNKDCNLILHKIQNFLGDIDVKITEKKGDASAFAKNSKADVVIVAGGDGTINEVINGLMEKKLAKTLKSDFSTSVFTGGQVEKSGLKKTDPSPQGENATSLLTGGRFSFYKPMNTKEIKPNNIPRLAIIPIGTSNMVARAFNIPKNIDKAILLIQQNRRKDLDIGRANNRYFAIACGVGIDAEMYKNVEPKIKKMFGEVAYPLSLLKAIFNYKPKLLQINVNGNKYFGYYVLVCNIAKFQNILQILPDSKYDDGFFDVLILQKKELPDLLRYLFGIATTQVYKFKDVVCVKATSLEITSEEPVIAHADAEIIGKTPIKLKMYEKAIEVIC